MDLYEFDRDTARRENAAVFCGVDEAGRGPLAGPVYAAAVILPENVVITGLNDSKKLTEKKREELYGIITEKAAAYCVATASVEEIDSLNILQATMLAMRRAVAGLSKKPELVLVDGNADPDAGIKTLTVIKGDGTSACIAAASILAKVSRDRFLCELDGKYPAYAFAKHKGYGTKLHYEKLDKYGACPAHRKTFLKKWLSEKA